MKEIYKAVTIINDCSDDNTKMRQVTRIASLLGLPVSYAGVSDYNTLSAGGNLIEALDAAYGEPTVILVNVAPRHDGGKQWSNGTPFGYFRYNNSTIITSVSGYTLSLIKKYQLTDSIRLLDIPTIVPIFTDSGIISQQEAVDLPNTQFRSYNFIPRVAQYFSQIDNQLPGQDYDLAQVDDVPAAVWWVDNFGNVKTTLWPEDVNFQIGKIVTINDTAVTCYERLKDVPDGETGLMVGSSGLGNKRFLELTIQGGRAADIWGFSVGTRISLT